MVGLPSHTDAFGFGDVSLLTIETDGTYHDLDVLKVVGQGATRLDGSVRDTPIAEVAKSAALAVHRGLLRKSGLCDTCLQCDVVDICGGGAVPHRYGKTGFDNPTVYCREMRALIRHARSRVIDSTRSAKREAAGAVAAGDNLHEFERAELSTQLVARLWTDAATANADELRRALRGFCGHEFGGADQHAKELLNNEAAIEALAHRPGVVAWSRAMLALHEGRSVCAVDGTPQRRDPGYMRSMLESDVDPLGIAVHEEDQWLRNPFGNAIYFENREVAKAANPLVHEALGIVREWRPSLAQELVSICRTVQFIRDRSAEPDKIVSFSDNAVPGALYLSVVQRDRLIDPYDLADSLIHEYRHQKLYLLERLVPLVEPNSQKVVSPWRQDLRPPSGLFHAIFVFVELRRFWLYVQSLRIERLERRASNQVADTNANLKLGLKTLASCPLTPMGISLASVLEAAAKE